ncbi:DUF4293 domain-containing protein [Hoylesella shahii]|jgi:hypothetical protein|uniref:DUF4293 domain-containing protein n=1 Tax=Hoylesella shahii TaxID=228603 RepID=UPI00288917F7|nr:DUF4293 domain-containing protein [Hoylesella shahii]
MWQRKQTVFMVLAIAFTVACLCLPIAHFTPKGMGLDAEMFNLWIRTPEGGVSMQSSALFGVLILTATIGAWTIGGFRNRPRQAKLCVVNMLLIVVWYALAAFYALYVGFRDYQVHANIAVCFPFVAMIFYWMARRGILADEKLVKAADRIR